MIRPRLALALLAAFIAGCANEPTEPTPQVTKVAKPVGSRAASLGAYSAALNSSLDPAVTFTWQNIELSAALGINDAGLVVGTFSSGGAAGSWTAAGGFNIVGNLDGLWIGGLDSYLQGVNVHGNAIGGSSVAGGTRVMLWSQATNVRTDLGPGRGVGINANGDVAGHADGGGPFYLPSGGTLMYLPLAPFIHGYTNGFNNPTSVIGVAWGLDGLEHAVVWPEHSGPVVDLGSLGGNNAWAAAINDANDIVGWSEVTPGSTVHHAVLWPATGGTIDLSTWPNGCAGTSAAGGINAAGIIVGNCDGQAVVWTYAQGMRPLSVPPGCSATLTGINNNLQIIGNCSGGGVSSVLWQPAQSGQTITFTGLAGRTFGDADFAVSATASSGLTVTFSATGSCTVTGTTVHLTGVGSCTITADQAGNAGYLAAPSVPQTFSIAQASQTISFGALTGRTYGDPSFGVSATASSGLAVIFTASGDCAVAASTVTIKSAGSCTLTAHQTGNIYYIAAPDVSQSFTIARATPSIAWTPPASMFFGTPLSAIQLSATATGVGGSPLAGTFSYAPPAGTLLAAGPAQLLSVSFNPFDATDYVVASKTVQIAVVYPVATDKDQCKKGGWQTVLRADGSAFKNQGDCIQYVNKGK